MWGRRNTSKLVVVLAVLVSWGAAAGPAFAAGPEVSIQSGGERYFSPNGDGQEDSASVVYCLAEPANVTITITDSSDTTVRTLDDDVSHPVGCGYYNSDVANWDGESGSGLVLPESVYAMHIHAVDSSGETSDVSTQLGIDTRTPGALTVPSPGDSLSGLANWVFVPAAGFPVSRVYVTCGGGGWSEAFMPEPDGTFAGSLETVGCTNGENGVTGYVEWTDPLNGGHSWTFTPVPVKIENAPQVSVYTGGQRYFSPNGDGQEDTETVYYCVSQPSNVTTTVTNSTGSVVKTIDVEKEADPYGCYYTNAVTWDGTNEAGKVVPTGVYTLHIHAVDSFGQVGETTTELGVETQAPGALTLPASGATLSGLANWVFVPAAGFPVSRVYVTCGGGGWSEAFMPEPDGTFAGSLETVGCTNGENGVTGYVEWTDPLNGGHSWTFTPVPVKIENQQPATPPELWIDGGHQYFSPNGDGQEDTDTVSYCMSQTAKVSATVVDSHGTTVRRLASEEEVNEPNCWWGARSFTWDGTNEAGKVVPDGVYTVKIHAVNASGLSAETSTEVGVETATPGELSQPAAGETLAGLARFAFTPTSGFDIDEVRLNFDTGGSTTIYNSSPDGQWHTSMYTGELASGPANLSTTVMYTDPFGVAHNWTAPVTPVTIDVTSLPLTFTADSKSGLAPLSTTFHIETSDPDARTLHYTLAFGDGTSTEGETSPPYTVLEIAHTYEHPGAYQAIATVTNDAGGASNRSIDIDATAPANEAPTAELALNKTSGPSPLTFSASISGSDPQNNPLTYTLNFGDGTTPVTGSLPHEPVQHTYIASGTYTVHLAVSDGKLTTTTTEAVHVSLGPPEDITPPEITGFDREDQTLTEVHGSWTNEPTEYKYQWLRCDPEGGSCESISGATKQTYLLTAGDVGKTLEVEEITKNSTAAGPAATSQPTGVVAVNRAPTATLESGPSGPTNHAGPFTFSADGPATFECSVDSEPFSACMSPLQLEGLPDGPHTLRIRAIGALGEIQTPPVTREFDLDTIPPKVTITSGPSEVIHTGSLGFTYESSEAGTLECAVDNGPYTSCEEKVFYAEEFSSGEHRFKVRAVDLAGNVSEPAEANFTIVDSPPTTSLEVSPEAGPAALTVTATIEGSDPDGDGLHYELQFGDGSQESGVLPTKPIEHTYGEPGIYEMRLDVTDGHEHTIVTRSVTVTLDESLNAQAGESQTVVVGEPVTLDGEDSRPLRGITSYHWDFGDGESSNAATVEHTYTSSGEYHATLTVRAPGAQDSSSTTIHVLPKPSGEGYVETVDSSGSPLEGAEVLVILGDGTRIHAISGGNGDAHLYGLPDGEYEAYVYKPGYVPTATHATVHSGEGSGSVELKAGEVATAQVTSHMMDLNEIEAAGINTSDPANRHVYEFDVNINVVPFAEGGGGGGGGSGSVGGYIGADGFIGGVGSPCSGSLCVWHAAGATIYTTVTYVPGLEAPLLSSLVIPFKASFLKEFFDVSMIVNNLAPAPFTLKGGQATIGIPGGMSLAPTAKQQTITDSLPDIPGEGSATAHWILRGDSEGEYNLAATYAASLEPFGRTINLSAATTTPVHVWGASALHLTVDVDKQVKNNYPFHVKVGLTDVADVPVYDPEIELLKKGSHGYIEQPQQQQNYGTREIAPGQTFWSGEFILVPEATGEVDLNHSFIQKIGGDVELASTLTTHERVPSLGGTPHLRAVNLKDEVGLEWEPVAGATGYKIYQTPNPSTPFTDQPVTAEQLPASNGMLKAVVPNIPTGTQAWFAVSSMVSGKPTMVHPLVPGNALSSSQSPTVSVQIGDRGNSPHTCGETQVPVTFTFEDEFFGLKHYEIKVGTRTISGDAAGVSKAVETTLDLTSGQSVKVTAQAENQDPNADNAKGPIYEETFDTQCPTTQAVVLATGLFSHLDPTQPDTSNAQPNCLDDKPQLPSGVDGFDEQMATNSCDAEGVAEGNLVSYLEAKGFDPGKTRESPNRTLLEFSYNGAKVDCDAPGGPTFVPNGYSSKDTIRDLGTNLADDSTETADGYVDALKQYSECWQDMYGSALSFTVVGHSEGGYMALAIARSAQQQGFKGLISGVVTVDGAIQPGQVLAELNPGGCLVTSGFLHWPLDVTGWLNQARNLPYRVVGGLAEKAYIGSQIKSVVKDGTRVATVTNADDPCLYEDATLNDAAETETWNINYLTGSEEHGAALKSHDDDPNLEQAGFPLTSFLDGRKYVYSQTSPGEQPAAQSRLARPRQTLDAAGDPEVSVSLTDTSSAPVTDGVAVLINATGLEVASGDTDENGQVELQAPAGNYTLIAGSRETKTVSQPIDLTASQNVAVVLAPAARVTVVVHDQTGQSIGGVLAAVYSGSEVVRAGFTDATGEYEAIGLEAGDYTVRLYEVLERSTLPEVEFPVHAIVGDPASGTVEYTLNVSVPTSVTAPTISGSPVERQTLAAMSGQWTSMPGSQNYQWVRCDLAGEHCSAIAGATAPIYDVGSEDVGHTLRVEEWVTNGGGTSAHAESEATSVVLSPRPRATIITPSDAQTYYVGEPVVTSFVCTEATGGPGLESCRDSNGAEGETGVLDTANPGAFEYTVTAKNKNGETGTATIHYTVVGTSTATLNPSGDNSGGIGLTVTGPLEPPNVSHGATEVKGFKTSAPTKPLTRAQKLAKALKACKKKPKKQRSKCARVARRRYAVKHKKPKNNR
jgi:PKD repeat protein/pimeloyl-ACP methyl ester carboxylesterase